MIHAKRAAIAAGAAALLTLTACGDDGYVGTYPGGGGGGQSALYSLSLGWDTESDAQTKTWLDQMTLHDHFVLEYGGNGAYKQAVFRRACAIDNTLMWTFDADGSVHNCATNAQQWQECIDFFGEASCLQNVELGRGDVLIYYRCRNGEIDQDTCNLYASINAQIDAEVANTSDTIVRNTGDQCRVGVDANCYP